MTRLLLTYPDYVLQLALLLHDPIYHSNRTRSGASQPILLIPGFLVGDWTLWVMAGWLLRLGYTPYLSGIDWNVRTPERTGELLVRRLVYIVEATGRPVTIVGHSLGGLLARFLGAACPELVRHVVAVGSPLHDSPQAVHPFLHHAFRVLQRLRKAGGRIQSHWPTFVATASSPLPTGIGSTAIFSTQDEIVDWRACVDPQGDNYQVRGRHLGLVVNREVYRLLADILGLLPRMP